MILEPRTFEDFVAAVKARVPQLQGDIEARTTLDAACHDDRLLRTLLYAGLLDVGNTPSEFALANLRTFGDAYEWCVTRANENELRPDDDEPQMADDLSSPRVRLRPVLPADFQWLYEVATNPGTGYRWLFRGTTPNPQSFGEVLYRSTLAQFVVERRDTNAPFGLVDAYDANTADRHAKFAIVSAAGSSVDLSIGAPGHVLEGAFLFICYLFRTFDFRKLYADIPGFNWDQFSSGEGLIFTTEGVLRQHDYFNGHYWDRRIVAIQRESWSSFAEGMMPTIMDSRRAR